MLDRIDVHCNWVSQSVLDLLPADLPDVPGGEVVREPGMGVFCDNAMDMVMDVFPAPDDEKKRSFVTAAMAKLNEVGLVGMHDAGAYPETLRLYADMAQSEDWTVRVYSMLECSQRNTFCPTDAAMVTQENDKFTVKSVKLFAGTSLLLPSFSLLSPAPHLPAWRGILCDSNGTAQTEPLAVGAAPCSSPTVTVPTHRAPSS